MKRFIFTIMCAMTFVYGAWAQFSGAGSGTEDDPYRIFNADQLNQVRNFLNNDDVYFSLEADIDMTQWIAENNPTQGWQPIGGTSSFRGTFKGNGHIISNLTINRPETDDIGLFGSIYGKAEISGIVLMDANYIGNENIGGIIGYVQGGNISSCSFYGNLKGNKNIGGIAGKTSSPYASGDMYIGYDDYPVEIRECYSYANISGQNICGGIVGFTEENYHDEGNITINNSYSAGIINGNECVGGIIGRTEIDYSISNNGKDLITKCYANSQKLNGKLNIGGIIGGADIQSAGSSFISKNFSINNTISSEDGIFRVGYKLEELNNYGWVLTNLILNDEVLPTPEDSPENGINIGLSTLKLKATYQGLEWDFDNVWEIQETECFPYLKTQTAPPYFTQSLKAGDTHLEGQCIENGKVTVYVSGKAYTTTATNNTWSIDVDALTGGDDIEIIAQAEGKTPSYVVTASVEFEGEGTEANPYLITSAKDLQKATGDAYYKLTTDLDLSEWIEENNDGNGWIPVGGRGPAIMAKIDGNGHKITNLVCDPTYEHIGLFAKIAKTGYVKNLIVEVSENAQLVGEENVGVIVGYNKGSVSDCHATANITGGTNVGGIAGQSDGSVADCHYNGTITGGTYSGGIVGLSNGEIIRCYTDGEISSSTDEVYAGGICGNVASGSLTDSYSTMTISVTGTSSYGAGIAGTNSGSIQSCYASGNISGFNVSGIISYNNGADALIGKCVALNSRIDATRTGLRVLGGLSSDSKTPGMDNYAMKDMIVSLNNIPQTIYDDPMNGTAKEDSELKQAAAYEELGWDMDGTWKIDEGYSYPYLPKFNVPVVSIELDETDIETEKGSTLELTASVMPENARNKVIVWSSSNENVATVSDNGTVKTLDAGSTTITATTTDGTNLSASCQITVTIPSGMNDVEAAEEMSISTSDGIIIINGIEDGSKISVHTYDGQNIYSGTQHKINVNSTGLYIVNVNGKGHKILVK